MKKILFIILISGYAFSCVSQKSTSNNSAVAEVSSLIKDFECAWSTNDSAAISNLFAPDAILFDRPLLATNSQEVAEKWIGPFYQFVKNMRTEKLQEWSTSDRAGYTGYYTLDIMVDGAIVYSPKGICTLNWVKNGKGEWKIITANMNSIDE